MKKKLLATVLALCMLLSVSTAALAADDGAEPTAPAGTGGGNDSTGAATVEGAIFDVTDDDDATAADAEDTTGADISLWGRIVPGTKNTAAVYKLDVAWGSLTYYFHRGAAQWDPVSHSYTGSTAASSYWTLDPKDLAGNRGSASADTLDYHKITVTNHTNHAMDVTYGFQMLAGQGGGTVFNADAGGADSVVANFFPDRAQAAATKAFQRLENTATMGEDAEIAAGLMTGAGLTHVLDTAEGWIDQTLVGNNFAGGREDTVLLVLSGMPDASANMDAETKIGTITVTFAPNTTRQAEYEFLSNEPVNP